MTKKFDEKFEKVILEFRSSFVGKMASITAPPEELKMELGDDADIDFLKVGYRLKIVEFLGGDGHTPKYRLETMDGERTVELTTDCFEVHGVTNPAISDTPYRHRRIREV